MTETHQTLVNNILYLASLVSDVKHIDPWLDRLRVITSRQDANSPLAPQDEQVLLGLQSKLKDYLVKEDPFRRFEPDVLEQKLYENIQGHQRYNRLRVLVGVIIGLSVGLGLGIGLAGGSSAVPQTPYLAGFVTFCVGAIFLLAEAARTFNKQLRQAYVMLCLVVMCSALLIGQFTLFGILADSWWVKTWAFTVFDAAIGIFLYLAFRTFAKQLSINSALVAFKNVAFAVVPVVIVCILLPHAATDLPEPIYDASVVGVGLLTVFACISVALGRAVVRKVGSLYKKAILCLIVAAVAMAMGGLVLLMIRLVWLTTGQAPMFASLTTMLLSIIGGAMFLYAAYVFNKTSRY